MSHTIRNLTAVAAAIGITLGVSAVAQASSIVYLKQGNVFLSSPDGTQGYQVTFDGGWDSPSQADDGTILAVRGRRLYRMTPSGQPMGSPVSTVLTPGAPATSSDPVGVRISPDGTRQAYWGQIYTSYADFSCGCVMYRWEAFTRWGYADHYEEPNQTKGQQLYGEPSWIGDGTLMLSNVGGLLTKQVATYAIGAGDNSMQEWFSDPDPGVQALQFGSASRAGDKLAFAASTQHEQDQIRLYATNGAPPAAPTPKCAITGAVGGKFGFSSFSPDGNTLAWVEGDGIHEGSVANLNDCSTITDTLVVAGATQPSWGPADVNLANRPTPPTASSGGTSQGTPTATAPAGGSPSGSARAPAGSTRPHQTARHRSHHGHRRIRRPQRHRSHSVAHRFANHHR